MKKIIFLIVLFFSAFSFAQKVDVVGIVPEKLTYAEYDDLKYIASIVPNLSFTDKIYRIKDLKGIILSSMTYSGQDGFAKFVLNGEVMSFATSQTGFPRYLGYVNKVGSNYFMTLIYLEKEGVAKYFNYVNKDIVWKSK